MPDVAGEPALAIAGPGPRQVDRRGEAAAAVRRPGEEDLATVRAAGEHDLLPQHEHLLAVDHDVRQPREHLRASRHLDRLGHERLAARPVRAKQDVPAAIVDPGDRDGAVGGQLDRRIVHVVELGLVHPPRALVRVPAVDQDRILPGHLRIGLGRRRVPGRGRGRRRRAAAVTAALGAGRRGHHARADQRIRRDSNPHLPLRCPSGSRPPTPGVMTAGTPGDTSLLDRGDAVVPFLAT